MKQEPLLSAFTRLRDNLLSMSRRILQDEDDATDAVQDAFCRLWPLRGKIKDEREASALTVTTTRNLCIDRVRQKSRFTEYDPESYDLCDEETTVESDAVSERFAAVKRLIDQELTENQRTILEMRDFRGLEIDEIASQLHMQPTAVRMNLSRARKTIREQYKKLNNHDR
ncbi:MAG TPA: sigma-70 family RNA polymerase sigma factor [Candidatus Barnesiella merdipullorum]|nr:sigma-70 family RNA polymerase sigma factor [Candidatus Barnesiella merdipullorum]